MSGKEVHETVSASERRVDIEIETEVEDGMTMIVIEVQDGQEHDHAKGVSILKTMIEKEKIVIGRGVTRRWVRLRREIEARRGAVKKISEVTERYSALISC